jgi:hypothetical protein
MGLAAAYEPRHPEHSLLYQVVAEHLETFLARQAERDRPVPGFVEREFRRYLECGVLAHGFLRVHCDACGADRLVPFACKGRGFCPSCAGRRMVETAAHLVDRVIPEVPVRQWVLSAPFQLRYRLAWDTSLVRDLLQIFSRAVFASLRRRAREQENVRNTQCGAVTFVQRFGGSLNLHVHFHMLALDGVYAADDAGHPRFHTLAPPNDEDVVAVTRRIAERTRLLLERRGFGPDADPEEVDSLVREDPLLASLYSASVAGRIATGPNAGQRVRLAGAAIEDRYPEAVTGPRTANVAGFSLHANVAVPPADRAGLERLCRYTGRGPLATERLTRPSDGRLAYRLKRPWANGTTHVIFDPLELLEKLAALVPAPRFHMVRYHGVLAPAAKWRSRIVPHSQEDIGEDAVCCFGADGPADSQASSRRPNYTWAQLLRRVFQIDVLECPRCGGPLRILAAIQSPEAIHKILDCLGLPARSPPIARARPEPNPKLEWA